MKNIAKIIETDEYDVACIREGTTSISFFMAIKMPGAILNLSVSKDYHVKFVVDHLFNEQNDEFTVANDGAECLREEANKMLAHCLEKVHHF